MISLIATVLNEGDNIHQLFESIVAQTRPPDEVVVVDGGSGDDTLAIMRGYADELPLRLFVEAGCNISRGRNRAIAEARGDIIAVTDAGVRLSDAWLERITAPLLADPALNVVGGFFQADPQSAFEAALGATTLPLAPEIAGATFLPSSRSIAFRKSAAEAIGGYPEWLDYCEDLVFDLRLREAGRSIRLRAGRASLFSTAAEPAAVFSAVLSLCARRWQSRSLAKAAPHSLSDVCCVDAGHLSGGRAHAAGALAALPRWRRRLLLSPLSPPANRAARRLVYFAAGLAVLHRAYSADPRDRRPGEDAWLSGGLALAAAAWTAGLARAGA